MRSGGASWHPQQTGSKLIRRSSRPGSCGGKKHRVNSISRSVWGTCGLAAGAAETLKAIEAELKQRNLQAKVSRVGCVGMCSYEPMVELQMPGRPRINYGKVTADRVSEILTAYLDGKPVQGSIVIGQVDDIITRRDGRTLYAHSFLDTESREKIAFHRKQLRIVLSNCGLIDPESIDDYLAMDGYKALEIVIGEMSPEQVIEEVKNYYCPYCGQKLVREEENDVNK